MISKAMGMIGLAQRAGKCISGTELCVKAARSGKASLVILDETAKENTQTKIEGACLAGQVPLMRVPPDLGQAIGKPGRMVCAVVDKRFAQAIIKLISDSYMGNNPGV